MPVYYKIHIISITFLGWFWSLRINMWIILRGYWYLVSENTLCFSPDFFFWGKKRAILLAGGITDACMVSRMTVRYTRTRRVPWVFRVTSSTVVWDPLVKVRVQRPYCGNLAPKSHYGTCFQVLERAIASLGSCTGDGTLVEVVFPIGTSWWGPHIIVRC